ncbi:hypothetical protein WDU94_007369 [Cyamophila willieti]
MGADHCLDSLIYELSYYSEFVKWDGIRCLSSSASFPLFQLTFAGYLERFSLKTHWFLFQDQTITSYNSVIGFMIMWLALSATFLWNFTDLFIMLVSAALAAQLRMFTSGLTAARGQLFTNNEWREYREAYTLLSLLVKKVDAHINSIIMLSVGSNVYFICAQLITEIE